MTTQQVDVAIIGAGTAGLYALREVKRAGKSFVLIDHGPLGTTCARVGCMPSKAALHAAELWTMRQQQAEYGVEGTQKLSLNQDKAWAKVREMRDGFAHGAANNATKAAGEHLIMGRAHFLKPTLLEVKTEDDTHYIKAKSVVIAVGSRPVIPGFLSPYQEQLITTDTLFDLKQLPKRLGVLGLGAIGLEMGLALHRLGVEVVGADMAESIAGIDDPEVSELALQNFKHSFPMHLGAPAELSQEGKTLYLQTQEAKIAVDKVLVALGRRPNIDKLNLAEAGFSLDDRGMPKFDPHSLQIEDYPVYIAGDANSYRTLLHEAAAEGAIAGFNAAHDHAQPFKRKTALAIAFTQPDIISVGQRLSELAPAHTIIGTARTSTNGRSRILTDAEGILRIYADKTRATILGASMIGARAEHVAQFLALAIDNELTIYELLAAPFYHPVVEETIQSALQDIARQLEPSPYPLGSQPQ